ncbi:putative aminopeptidase N [Penaeus vannamei]|uniref:Aminopeptidase n=1 Tax=Penaeus vannamei TaxID=6689 RepID=A0A423T6F3_PENVA|nr:aminopeptidase N-like [Penaeus vannamei]ROT72062.1 putative aminopeptidase N [Penaeus vannamei]
MMLVYILLILCHVTWGDVTTSASNSTDVPTNIDQTVPMASANTTSSEEKLNVRLPKSLKPLHYLLKLQPLVNGNFSTLGYVEVEMEVLEPTSQIIFHMADIITKNDTVKVTTSGEVTSQSIGIKRQEYDYRRHFYIAHLEEELQKGKKYVLAMEFLGLLNDQLRGFYRSTYKDADGKTRYLASTQFSPTDARRAFPCFDEPGFKATFEVHLARETWMTSLSNMPLVETVPMEGQESWVWDRYEKSLPMSTYIVAFVVFDFAHINSSQDGLQFRVWARENAIGDAEYASRISPKILNFFEDYFNISFPLPKQDTVTLPEHPFSAMENWGLIIYRESRFLFNPNVSTPSTKEDLALTVAHELAHQWFGNLVTPAWWDDLWLKEGFATYLSYVAMDYVEPSWKVLETVVSRTLQPVMNLDSLDSSHQISIPVGDPDDINEIFDAISYSKGASIVRMMAYFLNGATFVKGLKDYLNELKYKNAVQDDLWQYLTVAAHKDGTLPEDLSVKVIMDTWTLQKGYPVIHVTRSADGTSATVSQERFLLEKNANSSDTHVYNWWVPLTYTYQSEANFSQTQAMAWMRDSGENLTITSLPAKDQWVIFNLQQTGYYRVNYDDHNWNLLIQQLKDDHELINVVNRGQIIDDAMNLAKAGRLSYETALGLYAYLWKEIEYLPWSVAVGELQYINDMFKRTGGYGALKRYILDLILPLYNAVGFEDNINDPYLVQLTREIAVRWACKMGHKDCLDKVLDLYRRWMVTPDDTGLISPNLKNTVFCHAIAEGGEAEWNAAWRQYLKTDVQGEKNNLLSTLACTKQVWLLMRYLEMAVTPGKGIKQQDVGLVIGSVSRNDVGRSLAWDFLKLHWNNIITYKKSKRGGMLKAVTSSFNTKQDLENLEAFLSNDNTDLDGNQRTAKQVLERVRNNVAWMDANYDSIVQWLEKSGYSSKIESV